MDAPSHVRHESHLGRWDIVHRQPDPRLRPHVRLYQGYNMHTEFRHRTVPSGQVSLIINFGSPLFVGEAAIEHRSFIAGPEDTHGFYEQIGEAHGVQVDLSPIGAYLLVGQPMDELTNRVLELEAVFGAAAGRLVEQLRESPGWGERSALLDSFIAARLAEAHPASEAVVWAWRRVNQTGGRVKVGALAEELGWSGKHLISRFRQEVGLPPKTLARIVRFNRALRALVSDDSSDWAQIALDSGYYDQAHMIRDFHRFAGTTPADFLQRRLPDSGGVRAD